MNWTNASKRWLSLHVQAAKMHLKIIKFSQTFYRTLVKP